MASSDNFLFIIPTLIKWWKQIGLSALFAMVIMGVVMILQPNYYKSETEFYPVSASLLKPIVDASDQSLFYFGDDHDTDRLLSIGKSRDLVDDIIEKFNLDQHYEIKIEDNKSRVKLYKRFQKLYTITKTQHDAIRVEVEDKDPAIAAQLAEGVRTYINRKAQEIIKGTQAEMLRFSEDNMLEKKDNLDRITTEIKGLQQEYNIYDTESQAEALALIESSNPEDPNVKRMIDDFTAGVSTVRKLQSEQEQLTKLLVEEEDTYQKLLTTYQQDKSAIHIVEEANIPHVKSRPSRTLYVLSAGILMSFFTLFSLLIFENFGGIET